MSNSDSFIDEVTEEVRRDRLYGLARRYGWIVAVAIVLIVGGTAWREVTTAQREAEMAMRGDALFAALEGDSLASRAAALRDVVENADTSGVIPRLLAASETAAAGDRAEAAALYRGISEIPDLAPIYRDLAIFKMTLVLDDNVERRTRLLGLAAPGAPYRVLAEEQLAMLDLAQGDTEAALARLQPLLQDAEATQDQQRRLIQVIVALGATPELANTPLAVTDQ